MWSVAENRQFEALIPLSLLYSYHCCFTPLLLWWQNYLLILSVSCQSFSILLTTVNNSNESQFSILHFQIPISWVCYSLECYAVVLPEFKPQGMWVTTIDICPFCCALAPQQPLSQFPQAYLALELLVFLGYESCWAVALQKLLALKLEMSCLPKCGHHLYWLIQRQLNPNSHNNPATLCFSLIPLCGVLGLLLSTKTALFDYLDEYLGWLGLLHFAWNCCLCVTE